MQTIRSAVPLPTSALGTPLQRTSRSSRTELKFSFQWLPSLPPPQDSVTTLLAIHAAATWALLGLIWTVQVVHYPLFAQVGADAFRDYHARHMLRITFLVAPLMLVEVATAVLLLIRCAREPWLLASLAPLLLIWASTWRMQVPLHESLSNGFDVAVHRKLVASNWWRTGAWSVRGGCLLWGFS